MKYFKLVIFFVTFTISLAQGHDVQVSSFINALVLHHELNENLEIEKNATEQKINSYVKEYGELWDEKEDINFKCSDGIKTLPNYSSVTPNTELGIRISRNCNKLLKYQGSITNVQNNTDAIKKVLKKFNIKAQRSELADGSIILVKEQDIEVHSQPKKEVLKKDDIIKNVDKDDKEMVEAFTDKSIEVVKNEVQEDINSSCSVHAQTCEHLPLWPSEDKEVLGISCHDLRKSEGHKWVSRYNFQCRNNKIFLLADKYQYIKRMPCEIGGKKISKGEVKFSKSKISTYSAYACIGNMGVRIGSIPFMPVKCEEHAKKPGDEWTTIGEVQAQKCSGMCYANKKVSLKRSVEWVWRCDKFGHIIPSKTGGSRSLSKGKYIKSVLIDSQLFYQSTKKSKFVGESCQISQRENLREIRCDLKNNDIPACPGSSPIQVTKEERDTIDDMMFGQPVKKCREMSVYHQSNKCGGAGTKYLLCYNQCRNKCERDTSNEISESDVKLVNYYPKAKRNSSTKR